MTEFSLHREHPVDRLPDYARGGAPDHEAIEHHLRSCASCRLELELLRAMAVEPEPLSDIERERVYRGVAAARGGGGRVAGRVWTSHVWKVAAAVALLLTSVGVLEVIERAPVPGWDPQVALEGWEDEIADLGVSEGEIRLALGVGGLEDPAVSLPWDGFESEGGEMVPPWEEDR